MSIFKTNNKKTEKHLEEIKRDFYTLDSYITKKEENFSIIIHWYMSFLKDGAAKSLETNEYIKESNRINWERFLFLSKVKEKFIECSKPLKDVWFKLFELEPFKYKEDVNTAIKAKKFFKEIILKFGSLVDKNIKEIRLAKSDYFLDRDIEGSDYDKLCNNLDDFKKEYPFKVSAKKLSSSYNAALEILQNKMDEDLIIAKRKRKSDKKKEKAEREKLEENLKNNPFSRRHILSAWNPPEINEMLLPPCHLLVQFFVSEKKELSCLLYQRSGDMFLGMPFNIASYSLLTTMIAQVCGYQPKEFIHVIGDAHIYSNHLELVKEQISREPRKLPLLKLNPKIKSLFDFRFEDISLENYKSHPPIKAKVAV